MYSFLEHGGLCTVSLPSDSMVPAARSIRFSMSSALMDDCNPQLADLLDGLLLLRNIVT